MSTEGNLRRTLEWARSMSDDEELELMQYAVTEGDPTSMLPLAERLTIRRAEVAQLKAEAAAMREALVWTRDLCEAEGFDEAVAKADAALSWGGANTGETQAAERKVGK